MPVLDQGNLIRILASANLHGKDVGEHVEDVLHTQDIDHNFEVVGLQDFFHSHNYQVYHEVYDHYNH